MSTKEKWITINGTRYNFALVEKYHTNRENNAIILLYNKRQVKIDIDEKDCGNIDAVIKEIDSILGVKDSEPKRAPEATLHDELKRKK